MTQSWPMRHRLSPPPAAQKSPGDIRCFLLRTAGMAGALVRLIADCIILDEGAPPRTSGTARNIRAFSPGRELQADNRDSETPSRRAAAYRHGRREFHTVRRQ